VKTEVILYRQQLLQNPKFSVLVNYGWDFTGVWTTNEQGHLRNSLSTGAKTAFQSNILTQGVTYRLRFKLYNRTTGTLTVTNKASGTVHLSTTSNQIHIVEFTADGPDLIFNITNGFDGYISQTSLYQTPDKFNLDLTEDVYIPLNYSIDDVFNVNARKTPFSNTTKFPGTHNNNLAFGQIYKINSDSTLDPNITSRVIVKNSGITVFDGELCLDDIEKKFRNGITDIIYLCSLRGTMVSVYDKLSTLTVRDLNFSEYDHDYTIDRIYGSWFNDITINGVTGQANKTNTYTSPAITSENNIVVNGRNHIKITFASPHSFIAGDEVYYEPASLSQGYCYDQEILSVPSSTEVVLNSYRPTVWSGSVGGTIKKEQLTGIGYWYPCVDNGTWMKIHTSAESLVIGQTYIILTYNTGDDFLAVGGNSAATANEGDIFTATGTTPGVWTSSLLLTYRDISITNDTLESKVEGGSGTFWEVYDFVPHIFLREIFIKTLNLIGYDYDCDLIDTKYFRRLIIPINQKYADSTLIEGNPITINDHLPNILLKDIFNSIINMHNFALKLDGEDNRIIKFINRGDFFDNTPIEWTNKLDSSQGLQIQMLNRDLPKLYHFKHKESSDFYNKDWNEEFGDIGNTSGLQNETNRRYGDYLVSKRSDYLSDEKKIELIFEPSILTGNSVRGPLLVTETFNADDGGINVKRANTNRILLAGIRSTPTNFSLVSLSTPGDNSLFLPFYPHASHIDNFTQPFPSYDIGFGTPLGIYFTGSTNATPTIITDDNWDNNSIYKKYWRRYIEAVSNTKGKKVSGVFKLSAIDIYNIDFQIPIRVGDYVLKLNKVSGWDANGSGLCKCEFLLK
jgi:hypothetical protein